MKYKDKIIKVLMLLIFFMFIGWSFIFEFNPGKQIGYNFVSYSFEMLRLLPCVFILIGLFDAWVKRDVIEKHLGKESNMWSYVWAILLACPIAGGLLVAFPIAYSLFQKGAKLSIVFTFIGAAAVCRIPMTLFEASFLGIKFSFIRLLISIPLVVCSSICLGDFLQKNNYKVNNG
jgi:uncharacterized membrane protein YraQ (UPF0718 family)